MEFISIFCLSEFKINKEFFKIKKNLLIIKAQLKLLKELKIYEKSY